MKRTKFDGDAEDGPPLKRVRLSTSTKVNSDNSNSSDDTSDEDNMSNTSNITSDCDNNNNGGDGGDVKPKYDIFCPPKERVFLPSGYIVYENDIFEFEYLWNDKWNDSSIENLENDKVETLCYLKNIIATALPKMGSKYVTRHVFDPNHRLLACRLKDKQQDKQDKQEKQDSKKDICSSKELGLMKTYPNRRPIIGGICIRPFYECKFGEVVFLAVDNSHQHRSVGRQLMRVMKQCASFEMIEKFYTYADNKAIGFFTKLGFKTKNVTKNTHKEKFWQYIKHYDGSELMESNILKNLNYINFDKILQRQQQEIVNYCKNKRKEIKLKTQEKEKEKEKEKLDRNSNSNSNSKDNNINRNSKENSVENSVDIKNEGMRRSKRLANQGQTRSKKSLMEQLGVENAVGIANNGNDIYSKRENGYMFGISKPFRKFDEQIELSLKYGQAKLLIELEKRDYDTQPKKQPSPHFLVCYIDVCFVQGYTNVWHFCLFNLFNLFNFWVVCVFLEYVKIM